MTTVCPFPQRSQDVTQLNCKDLKMLRKTEDSCWRLKIAQNWNIFTLPCAINIRTLNKVLFKILINLENRPYSIPNPIRSEPLSTTQHHPRHDQGVGGGGHLQQTLARLGELVCGIPIPFLINSIGIQSWSLTNQCVCQLTLAMVQARAREQVEVAVMATASPSNHKKHPQRWFRVNQAVYVQRRNIPFCARQ